MFFKQLLAKEATLSYLFGCGGKGKAVAVDVVAGDESWFIDSAIAEAVSITHVIDTHVHADHYSGGRTLAEQLRVPYCLHASNAERAKFTFQALHDQDIIDCGNVSVQVLYTPGHTLDSICLLVTDQRRGNSPWFVITGDTLFVGAIGRPDLAGKEQEMAALLYESIHQRLLKLDDTVELYPGHKSGSVCGAGISGKPSSTIGFERRMNPNLRLNKTAFVDMLLQDIPPRPASMEQMVAFNLGYNT
jgi:glyoxylase-like metal-dependent hydrolase (beta-lactamase superfamily II)